MTIFILVYVDDILITGNNEAALKKLIKILDTQFSLKDLGEIIYFPRLEVKKPATGLFLSQSKYINDFLCKANMQQAKSTRAPLTSRHKFLKYGNSPIKDPQRTEALLGLSNISP